MKVFKRFSQLLTVLLILGMGVSCEKSESLRPEAAEQLSADAPLYERLASQGDHLEALVELMAAKNIGEGVIFIEPTFPFTSFSVPRNIVFEPGVGLVSGQIASFGGTFGSGDFWRQNPDGTVSVKLTDSNAEGAHFDFGTGEEYLGTGNLNVSYTGILEVVEVPFPPFELKFIDISSESKAQVIHGKAKVSLDGNQEEASKKLRMWWNGNPGGQSKVQFSLRD